MKNLLPVGGLRGRSVELAGLAGVVLLSANSAVAAPPSFTAPSVYQSDTNAPAGITPFGFVKGMARSQYMLGDMWGLRPWMSKYGVSLNISETSEVLGNLSGGYKRGADYDGLTTGTLQLDTQRAFGLHGGLFDISGLQIHGRNFSEDYLGTLQTASGIEADRATRMWELWYQQKFLSEDRADIKIGQQSLDQEFMVSQNALMFVNTMFGWPMVPSADMPGGGPAYPLSAPGVRLRIRPLNSVTFLAGVFSGSPAPNSPNPDAEQVNSSGVSFPLDNGTLVIAELQYTYPSLGSMVSADGGMGLSGTYRLGAWYDSENFPDEQNPNASHRGNYSIYAVADQMLWSDPNDEDGDRTINFFARAMGTPLSDRNLIDFSLNAGFTFHEPIPHRSDDQLGIGMGYTHVSHDVADTEINNNGFPVQSGEAFVELTYQYELTPWCQLQPDFQYVFNPGGGISNPDSGNGARVKNEAVIGLRMNLNF